MTPEVSKLLEQALSLSVEEQGRWRIPRFSTSVASWVKEYKRPGKPRSGSESQNWNPARHKPLLGRRCAGAIWRSCLMPTSLAKFHDEAASEYDAAFDWYLARSPDAALKFDAEVDRALAEIMQATQRWAVAPCSPRRFLLRQFPFTLIYREQTSADIQIVAVAHTSWNPGYRKRRR
jgi:plasmid stabilization system protein ParE